MSKNLNVLWVDDDLEDGRQILFGKVEKYFLSRKVSLSTALSSDEAKLKINDRNTYYDQFDIIMLDQQMGNKTDGEKLGEWIISNYPFIALIMLTGKADDLTTCKNVMRMGFCDFIGLEEIKKNVDGVLNRVMNLPVLKSKQNLKLKHFNALGFLHKTMKEMDSERLQSSLKENSYSSNELEELVNMLNVQEKILEIVENKKINNFSKKILESVMSEVIDGNCQLNQALIDDCKKKHREDKNLRVNKYSSHHFKATEEVKLRGYSQNISICTTAGLKVIHVLKYKSDLWPTTIELALQYAAIENPKSNTLIDQHYKILKEIEHQD